MDSGEQEQLLPLLCPHFLSDPLGGIPAVQSHTPVPGGVSQKQLFPPASSIPWDPDTCPGGKERPRMQHNTGNTVGSPNHLLRIE